MKIIKSFDDFEFFTARFPEYGNNGTWTWGLGDDGELYCKCVDFVKPSEWYSFTHELTGFSISLRDMKRIVKEFGHLLVFM